MVRAGAASDSGVRASRTNRNVELSREGFRRFEAGDIEGLMDLYADQATIWHPEGWPESGPSRGRNAIMRQFRSLREGWSEHRVTVQEIEGRGDWVVARVRWRGRGNESGVDVELSYSAATRFEGSKIAEVHYCWSHLDAARAAGWST